MVWENVQKFNGHLCTDCQGNDCHLHLSIPDTQPQTINEWRNQTKVPALSPVQISDPSLNITFIESSTLASLYP